MKTIFDRITLLSILLFLGFSSTLCAQQESEREVGIRFTGLDSFGILFKKKKANGKFRRLRLGYANLGLKHERGRQALNFNANVAFGTEKRKAINERFHFITGAEFLGHFNLATTKNNQVASISPGIGFVLGFQYAIADRFYVSVETVPAVIVEFGFDEDGFKDGAEIKARLSSAASLNLVYQFKAKKGKV